MNNNFSVSFTDLAFLLAIAFLFLANNQMNKHYSINKKINPAVFLFIEKTSDNHFSVRCNGHKDITPRDVIKIARQSGGIKKVLVIASIEGDVPYRFWWQYEKAIKIYNLNRDKKKKNNNPFISWDTQLLGN